MEDVASPERAGEQVFARCPAERDAATKNREDEKEQTEKQLPPKVSWKSHNCKRQNGQQKRQTFVIVAPSGGGLKRHSHLVVVGHSTPTFLRYLNSKAMRPESSKQ